MFLKFFWICFISCILQAAVPQNITQTMIEQLANKHAPQDEILQKYVAHFPLEKYEVVNSRSLGCYFIEKDSDDMIKKVIREGWHREWHVASHFRPNIRLGSIVLDIGAHIGTHTMTLADAVGPYGKVYAFEPQVKLYTELLINLQLNGFQNVTCLRLALGNEDKWVEMNPPCLSNEGGVSLGTGGDRVQMIRLDDFHLDNVSLMKIDVEGLEMEVLAGAQETIQRNRPVILLEIMGHVGYSSAAPETKRLIEDRIHVVEAMGYQITHLGIADFLCIPR